MKVYSEPGKGTRLTLYFPHYRADGTETKKLEEDEELSRYRGTETVLVVDDEPALISLTAEILESQGCRAFCANKAKEALNLLDSEAIQILVSDVIMPEMNGYQLASIVQKKYPDIKIQLASGFSTGQNRDMVGDKIHENLLPKPYNARALLRSIRMLADSHQ